MASGFEVVGLALAVFPILVGGLRLYANKKGRVRDFIHYRHILQRVIRDLSREQISFRNSSRLFLENISVHYGLTSDDIQAMMRNPQDARWRKEIPCQNDQIKEMSVAIYLETVEDMNEVLMKIQGAVGIHEGAQPALLKKSTLRRQWSKIKLLIGEEDIKKHLERARGLNMFLSQLTEQNKPACSAGGVVKRSTQHYKRIRKHAIELFEIFQANLSTTLTCKCVLGHTINMRLECRSAQITAKRLLFHTIFTFDRAEPNLTPPVNWREIEIEPLPSTQLCHERESHKMGNSLVRPSAIHAADSSFSEIPNICTVIKSPTQSGIWLGYLATNQGCRHRIRVLAQDQIPVALQTIQTVSLAAVLDDRKFHQEYRYRLGVKLASSVMQLHATQWLADYWNKTDISFPCFSDGKVDFNNPLIKRDFGSEERKDSLIASNAGLNTCGSIPCLFSLGIVLLELIERQTIETMNNILYGGQITGQMTAELTKRLASSVDCTPNYKRVIKRCIGGLDAAFESLEDDGLRDEVERKIILPLEEDLKFYCDTTYIEDCM